ncbi:cupin domain-containing protein [Desulfobacter vibrioformis]|uniref:cupin domain-containing protein n=1 Tax=Desulfobacter vibrioformis TaxID=34031 RepID=UPI000558CB75|nr:cupin domain-containing protein [Desulfobacter vibrioformis]
MFAIHDENGYAMSVEGIEMKTLVYGDKTLLVRFKMTKGAQLPSHTHPHEQIGYLVSGRINLYIGSECRNAGPGDSWCIESGVEHRAEILEDSIAIEVFSPVREEYLPGT